MPLGADRFKRPFIQRLAGFIGRMSFWYLLTHHDSIWLRAAFSFILGGLSIAILCAVAMLSGFSVLFPPLGPTAFIFFSAPSTAPAAPRSAVLGHLSGLAAGWISVLAIGAVTQLPQNATITMTWPVVTVAALSMALTSTAMVALRAPHPPAAATALMVSLGLLDTPAKCGALAAGLAFLVLQAFIVNRFAGLRFPLWAPHESASDGRTMIAEPVEPKSQSPSSPYGLAAKDLGTPGSAPREGPPPQPNEEDNAPPY